MALVNIEHILSKVLRTLEKMAPPQGIEILSYKRNRGVAVLRQENDTLLVRERGYDEKEYSVNIQELPKLLKSLLKHEFPRSRKVRLYNLASPEDVGQDRKKL
jgi:hypothetical protein